MTFVGGFEEEEGFDEEEIQQRFEMVSSVIGGSPEVYKNVFVSSEEGAGCSLVTTTNLAEGAVVFRESPRLLIMPDGYCKFCGEYHENLATSGWIPDSVKPSCKDNSRFLKMATPIFNMEDCGEFNEIEPKKLHLVLQFMFELGDATQKEKKERIAEKEEEKCQQKQEEELQEGEDRHEEGVMRKKHMQVLELHYEDSCEHLRVQTEREKAAKLILEALPEKYRCLTESELVFLVGVVDTNSFEVITALDTPTGAGLYMVSSMMNHCCAPNCYFQFDDSDKKIFVTARNAIRKGERVTISYDSIVEEMDDRNERLVHIAQNLGFICRCEHCEIKKVD